MKIAEYETEDGKVGVYYRKTSVASALFVGQDDITVQGFETAIPLELDDLCRIKRDLADEIDSKASAIEVVARLERVLEDMGISLKEDGGVSVVDLRNWDRVYDRRVKDVVDMQPTTAKNISPADTRDYLRSMGGRR